MMSEAEIEKKLVSELKMGIEALETIGKREHDPESNVSREEIDEALEICNKLLRERWVYAGSKEAERQEKKEYLRLTVKTPRDFINWAMQHYNKKPKDLQQFSMNMWFAMCWSLKRFLLHHKILVTAHRCYKYFATKWLVNQTGYLAKNINKGYLAENINKNFAASIDEGFWAAIKLHEYTYGGELSNDEFVSCKNRIEKFVNLLLDFSLVQIDKRGLRQLLKRFINETKQYEANENKSTDMPELFVHESDVKNTSFCGENYDYKMSDVVRKLQAGIQALEAIKAGQKDPKSEVSCEAIEQTLQTYKKLEEEAKKWAAAGKKDEVIEKQGLTTVTNEFDPEKAKNVAASTLETVRKEQNEWTTVTNEKYVDYTPERFLTEAFAAYKADPCHLDEFAEKMFWAFV